MKKETYKELYWLMDKLTDINHEIEVKLDEIETRQAELTRLQNDLADYLFKVESIIDDEFDEEE